MAPNNFEDAIQHEVAIGEKSIQAIITRNTKDYKKSVLPIFPPGIWVKMMENEEIWVLRISIIRNANLHKHTPDQLNALLPLPWDLYSFTIP